MVECFGFFMREFFLKNGEAMGVSLVSNQTFLKQFSRWRAMSFALMPAAMFMVFIGIVRGVAGCEAWVQYSPRLYSKLFFVYKLNLMVFYS